MKVTGTGYKFKTNVASASATRIHRLLPSHTKRHATFHLNIIISLHFAGDYLRFGLRDVLRPEQELAVQVGHVDRVKINHL